MGTYDCHYSISAVVVSVTAIVTVLHWFIMPFSILTMSMFLTVETLIRCKNKFVSIFIFRPLLVIRKRWEYKVYCVLCSTIPISAGI